MDRIDVHHHYASPGWLSQKFQPPAFWSSWTPQRALEEMDRNGVARALLSITTPGVGLGEPDERRRLARECNDYAATMRAAHPGRFGIFTVVPLPDIEGTLAEIAYGFDTLHADGVGLMTNYDAKWLGDPQFDPIFAELDQRRALVFVHPTTAPCCTNLVPGVPDSAIEYGTDTTRAIARMIFSGSSRRYPHVRLIFSHAGGTMPFLNARFVQLAARNEANAKLLPDGFIPEARRFFYDVAQAANPAAMSALTKIVPTSQIVFGSDYPYITIGENVRGLEECGVFSPAELKAIDRENALALLGAGSGV